MTIEYRVLDEEYASDMESRLNFFAENGWIMTKFQAFVDDDYDKTFVAVLEREV